MSKEIQMKQEPATSAETNTKRSGLFTRQRLSPLGKIAFWSFLLLTIGGIGGAVAIAIGSGATSLDLVIFAVVSLVTTLLIVSGIRWLQTIGCLASVYVLYLQFVQPFIIESLTHPKTDPNGGYGHFIGNVFTVTINLLGIAACIGAVAQDYRRGSRKYPAWFTSVLGGVAGLIIGSLFVGAVMQPPDAAAHTLTYTNGVPTVHLNPGGFDLTSVTITKGSKLLLVDDTTEQHVLTNGTWQNNTPLLKREPDAPLLNKLSLTGNSVPIGPFAVAGTYHVLCLIHHGMNLTIIVQ